MPEKFFGLAFRDQHNVMPLDAAKLSSLATGQLPTQAEGNISAVETPKTNSIVATTATYQKYNRCTNQVS